MAAMEAVPDDEEKEVASAEQAGAGGESEHMPSTGADSAGKGAAGAGAAGAGAATSVVIGQSSSS
jgi:hypothetical protein